MQILHVLRGLELTSGISAFLVENANRQAEAGHNVAILYERAFEYRPSGNVKVYNAKSPDGIDFLPDIVHIHSVWSLFSVRAMIWCQKKRIPYVVSPHGCLMPSVFKRGWLKKKLFFHLLLKPLMSRATAIHATAAPELEEIRRLGFAQMVATIPLGVDLSAVGRQELHSGNIMLFMGRLSPEKGLLNLLRAWRQVDRDGWKLCLAGPDWRAYKKVLDEEILRLHLSDEVVFTGGVSGKDKDAVYRRASCFVLPSPMENFSAVVLEALSYGLPVIATTGTPWGELRDRKCGWWIGQGENALADAFREVFCLKKSELEAMGRRGRDLASEKYSWNAVAKRTVKLYESAMDVRHDGK